MDIQITVNGAQRPIPHGTTVAALVHTLDLGDRRVAVEVNGAVVPRGAHADTPLSDGDRVEIVHAIGGG
jgi:sulfur carrier protein